VLWWSGLAGRGTIFAGTAIMARSETDNADTWLGGLPPTSRQSWSAVAVAAVALVAFGAVAPFAGRPLAELNAFFPSLDAIVFVTDLITSVLLFAQFSISRSRALLVLASGYLFTSLIVIPHALTFSGAFSPTGLLGASIQTGSWLFIFWHVGFAATLLAYALLGEEKRAKPISEASTLPAIGWSVASALGLVCGLTWLATSGVTLLPPIILDKTRISPLVIYPISFAMLISAAALAVLLARRRSVLDQWLIVVALMSILELAFSGLFPSVRFSVGFYAGRVFSLATSSIALIVVLAETTLLYAHIAHSVMKSRRDREGREIAMDAMAASIAHEINQPLGAMVVNGNAGLRWLERAAPDIDEARAAFTRIVNDGRRASEVITSIRGMFKKDLHGRARLGVNDIVREVLAMIDRDLRSQRVSVSLELREGLPQLLADRGQLQQVFLNLMVNALEAMRPVTDRAHVLRIRSDIIPATFSVTIMIEDSGMGIDGKDKDRMFEPFFTTKSAGTGVGLTICRSIIQAHGGSLRASANNPYGTIFHVVLPSADL
jgi:signal transduction histidine kinase